VITRRSVLLAGGLGLVVAHRRSYGQTKSKIPRIRILWFGLMDTPAASQNRSVFRQRLATLGYVEGKNIVIDERSARGDAERLSALARELAASKVDVIVASAVAASRAARQATSTIPIVMVHAGDPIGAGLIASLARPGGNVTGTTNLSYAGKQIGLVRELVPRSVKLAILLNPSNANAQRYVTDAMEAGSKFNISISVAEVARAEDFPNAFAMIRARSIGRLVVRRHHSHQHRRHLRPHRLRPFGAQVQRERTAQHRQSEREAKRSDVRRRRALDVRSELGCVRRMDEERQDPR
jgi:putative ABC transport system substrate-binding protein